MKKILGWGTAAVLAAPALAVSLYAQAPAPASIQGKVNDALGNPLHTGDVKLTTDLSANKDKKFQYTFPVDANGNFTGTGIAPGTYFIGYFSGANDSVLVDYFAPVTIAAGQSLTENFDMTRPDFLKGMSKEQLAALEETKKKNAAVNEYNSKVKNLNQLMQQARDETKAGNTAAAIKDMQDAVAIKPDEGLLYVSLGEAQLADANKAAAAARAAKTPLTDPALQSKYNDAAASYQKGIDLLQASKKPDPNTISIAYMNIGEADAKAGKSTDASQAYDKAVQVDPKRAATAYYNEAANFFNLQDNDAAAAAADKGIAADPKKADLYYIKGQSLIPKATVDPKTQKYILPPGCLEAYQEYLELAPDGPHAADVKALLAGLGQQIKSTYRKGKG